jgi:hypothetical protein
MNEPLELMVWIGLLLGAALISIGHAWRLLWARERTAKRLALPGLWVSSYGWKWKSSDTLEMRVGA